jgi:hypothetical protein
MNVYKTSLVLLLAFACSIAGARGGASSGGGHASSGGHSSSVSSRGGFSSAPASRPAPAPAPSAAPRPAPTTPQTNTTTTTTQRSVNYGPGYAPGYYHNDGLLTGLIIGNMMHPTNTVVYSGPGPQGALLYPDGRVVNQQGQQIGTYQNGTYSEVQNGAIVAQPAPVAPAEKEKSVGDWFTDILGFIALVLIIFVLVIILIGILT